MILKNRKCPLWVGSGKFSPKCLDLTIGDRYRPLPDQLANSMEVLAGQFYR